MMRGLDIAAMTVVLAAIGPAHAQIPPVGPTTPEQRPTSIDDLYPDIGRVDLEHVVSGGTSLHRKKAVVRGRLAELEYQQYFSLSEGIAQVMLIPLDPGDHQDYRPFLAMDVEVTGIVRLLPTSQKTVPCRGQMLLESKCEDPELPVLPNARMGWPGVSITVIKLVDISERGPRRHGDRDLANTGLEAAAADGKPVTAVGQFRGANLCRDLPDPTRRDPRDWVLLTEEGPVWVTGRRPEGGGFRFDPAYRGDVGRWLEVTGRVTAAAGALYLKAGKVALIPRPPEAEATACAPDRP
jgi:hypothetical protein